MTAPSRRGFVLPLVILIGVLAAVTVAVSLQRLSVQQGMVQRQINAYHRHHDMLGAKAVIRFWVTKQQDLSKVASETRPAHRFSLPGGMRVTVYISDGQGSAKGDFDDETSPERRRQFEQFFYRLPAGRSDLVRRTGPPEISVNSAPREVLAALRPDDAGLAGLLLQARERRRLDAGSFRQVLERAGVRQEEINDIMRLVVYEPALWKLTVEAEQDGERRTFTALVEPRQSEPALHEWRELRRRADAGGAGETLRPYPNSRTNRNL